MSIKTTNLSCRYGKNEYVLSDISFEIPSAEFICLLGPNGVGKSTLFKCMLGLFPKYEGTITIDGTDIKTMTPKALARKIAYIPQSSPHVFNYPVRDIVLMGTTSLTDGAGSPKEKEMAYVTAALDKVGISRLKDKMFLNISGGERQLVLIARALAQQAKILFMDEPTANLDYGNQIHVLEHIKALVNEGYTVVQSTHNPEQAFLFADKVLAVKNKGIAAYGAPREIMTPELLKELYNIDVAVESLYDDKIRICIPESVIDRQ